jgi:molybdopterin-containing oxidoreductase family membrane subunit
VTSIPLSTARGPLLPTDSDPLRDAAMAPARRAGRKWLLLVGALAVLVLAGAAAYAYQLVAGIGVTGLNDQVFWGIYTSDLVTFIGFSYGGALTSALLRLMGASWRGPVTRIAEATALATLLVGATFPIIHLGRPERVWEIFLRPNLTSPLFWDMVSILTYLFATLILFFLPMVPDMAALASTEPAGSWRGRLYRIGGLGWTGAQPQRRALDRGLTMVALLIVPLAVTVHTVLSYAFSLTSRPGWHSTIFGPYFVIAAVYSGVAVVILATIAYRRAYHLQAFIPERTIHLLGYLMVALAVVYGYFTFTELTTEGYSGAQSDASLIYQLILQRAAPQFWFFVVGGLLLPVLLVVLPRTRTPRGIAIAASLVIGAMLLKRLIITVPPQERPLIGGEWGAYFPSPVELLVTLGAAAGVVLIILLLFRVFPVLAVDEIESLRDEARHPELDTQGGVR